MSDLNEDAFPELQALDARLATAASWAPQILRSARRVINADGNIAANGENVIAVAQVIALAYNGLIDRSKH